MVNYTLGVVQTVVVTHECLVSVGGGECAAGLIQMVNAVGVEKVCGRESSGVFCMASVI